MPLLVTHRPPAQIPSPDEAIRNLPLAPAKVEKREHRASIFFKVSGIPTDVDRFVLREDRASTSTENGPQ
ncbi:hypothetical protein HYFRA_00007872 [Hymenoscyphus fraxineus]|uniref:Uncharacterized protein n=1 Tax=Hymenoscyphus fraxineus TaxID=746836 RepID=A0A9N9KMC1_9HELO|nr:hypothetical protein HYFRA_00007872 [Hymenoscyphus fraxineus]